LGVGVGNRPIAGDGKQAEQQSWYKVFHRSDFVNLFPRS
jgi:hypothetical protein